MVLEPKGVINTGDAEKGDLTIAPKPIEGV